jgi:hypothetical protein
MRASRWTFATIDAAAIEPSRASRRRSASAGTASAGIVNASTSTWSGAAESPTTARRIASRLAPRVLRRSTSIDESSATHTATAWLRISRSSSSRCAAVSCLESSSPGRRTRAGSTTAAATSGPASGPTPTSSTPAITRAPPANSSRPQREQPRDAAQLAAAIVAAPHEHGDERARAAARIVLQEAQPARLERGRDAERELLAQLRERAQARIDRARHDSSGSSAARSSARTRRNSSGSRESAADSRCHARSSRCGVPITRAPAGTSLCTPDCGPMNARSPMRLLARDAGLPEQHDAVLEHGRARDAGLRDDEALLTDTAVVSDLHQVVDLGAAADPRVAQRAAIDRGVGADLDVVGDPHAPDLVRLGEAAALLARVAESAAADHDAGLQNHAIAVAPMPAATTQRAWITQSAPTRTAS